VPAECIVRPSSLQPAYATVDRETEEESWIEATTTGQTRVGADGRRWIGKPKHPVGRYMQGVYLACHRRMGKRLSAPVTAEIRRGAHWMDFHQLFRWRLALRAMTLEQFEELHRERLSAAQAYIEASRDFEPTPQKLMRWHEAFVRMNGFVGLSYNIHKVAEGLLEHELAAREIPEPYYSEVRSAIGASLGETEATKQLRDYKRLLDEARRCDVLSGSLRRVDGTGDLAAPGRGTGDFLEKLRRHACRYKIIENTDMSVPLEVCVLKVALCLKEDVARDRQVEIPAAQPAEFYPDDERFCRIARLALGAEKARQDAHHLLRRGQWFVIEKLNPLADRLVQTGKLRSRAGLFDHSFAYLVWRTILYNIAR